MADKEIDVAKITSEAQAGIQDLIKMIESFVAKDYDAMSIYLVTTFAEKIGRTLMKETYPKADEEKFKIFTQVIDISFEMYQAGLNQKKDG